MSENKLLNDTNFRKKCCELGLDWRKFKIHDDTIILSTPRSDVFVLLDEHYNVIGIPKIKQENSEAIEEYVSAYKEFYGFTDKESGICFSYPFQDLSLNQIVALSKRIFVNKINHGHSSYTMVNGDIVTDKNDSNYVCLLSYIKFLGKQIDQYYKNLYKMRMMGLDYPDVYTYINKLMSNIDECINQNIEKGKRPFPVDIIDYLGQDRDGIEEYDAMLYRVIDLLLKEKGYKIKSGEHYMELEKIEKDDTDLSNLVSKLLKITDMSYEEFEFKYLESYRAGKNTTINLESWLSQDGEKEKNPNMNKIYKTN